MKKLLVLIVSVWPLCTFAQQGDYTIKGNVGKLNAPAKAYVGYSIAGKQVTDSAVINNGSFEIKGTLKQPVKAELVVVHGKTQATTDLKNEKKPAPIDRLQLYLEKGNITITSADSIKNATISGSALNDENQRLTTSLKPWNIKLRALTEEYTAASDEEKDSKEFTDKLQEKAKAIYDEINKINVSFIKNNPNSYVSFDVLKQMSAGYPEVSKIEPLYNQFPAEIKSSSSGVELANKIKGWKRTDIGVTAPDFTQDDVNGNPVSLSSFRGKYVLLDFWASWCGPCRQENPSLTKAYNAFKDKNFTIIGISLDSGEKGKEAWLKAIETDQLEWTQLSDLKGRHNEVAQKYAIQGIPMNFLLDPNGKIVARNLRGEALAQKLSEILK